MGIFFPAAWFGKALPDCGGMAVFELFKKFEMIQEMEGETKKMIMNFLDLAIRDFKAKQAYAS